jgi:toxin ParE1/3/4
MKVVIRSEAERDLTAIFEWIAKDNPPAARKVVGQIRDRITLLELNSLARMGRPGFVPGTLELVEYPYIVVYRVLDDAGEIEIVAIVHGARKREPKID